MNHIYISRTVVRVSFIVLVLGLIILLFEVYFSADMHVH